MQTTNNEPLRKENEFLFNELTLWHNELMFYNKMLLRLAALDVPKSDTDQMEEFKSRFDNLQDKLVKMHESMLNSNQSHENGISESILASNREKIHGFEKEFKALKNDFFVFSDREDY